MLALIRRRKLSRALALFLAIQTLSQSVWPTAAFALTSGPHSPEFSGFEPVATTDMVNLFSGDFNYNLPVLEIPGPDGAGYALSLGYNSGNSSEEEASWVGFGWNLSPGSVNRSVRGFPDDYATVDVMQYNQTRPNWSASITSSSGLEISSKDEARNFGSIMGLTSRSTLRFNNYQGYARTTGFGVTVLGAVSLNAEKGAQGTTYSAEINFLRFFNKLRKKLEEGERTPIQKMTGWTFAESFAKQYVRNLAGRVSSSYGSTYGIYSFSHAERATGMTQLNTEFSRSRNFSTGLTVSATPGPISIGWQTGMYGNYNVQMNKAENRYRANGYMHNPAGQGKDVLSDYYVERNTPYNKRDLYLGIPFNNADQFSVNGEGISGGFRFYPRQVGHFYPDPVENVTNISQGGFELTLGLHVGVGFNFGVGRQKGKVGNWKRPGNTGHFTFGTGGEGNFRFMQDMGGEMVYANSRLVSAEVNPNSWVPGLKNAAPKLPEFLPDQPDPQKLYDGNLVSYNHQAATGVPLRSSSHISYHTASEVGNPAARFNQTANQRELTNARDLLTAEVPDRALKTNPKAIVEMNVLNADGIRYVYGLPVLARNEANLQFDVNPDLAENRYLVHPDGSQNTVENRLIRRNDLYAVDQKTTDPRRTTIGEIRNAPYATSYLLTQITTPEYVDVQGDGVDESDFGGWTQFHYHQKAYTEGGRWYSWRTPYNGLLYQPNELSDRRDDMGALLAGEKENYYLKAIETKSHVAYFVTNETQADRFTRERIGTAHLPGVAQAYLTGSQTLRKDGLGAQRIPENQTDPATDSKTAKGNQRTEYLEKIVLFSKDRPEKPLKVIHFAYDYSLVQNLPNNTDGQYPAAKTRAESGKLTLRRVWFEYEGVSNSRISPYEFSYAYKKQAELPAYLTGPSTSKYPQVLARSSKYAAAAENPDYAPHLLDPWGSVQQYGKERRAFMIPWVYQGEPITAATPLVGQSQSWQQLVPRPAGPDNGQAPLDFDPAAWQLKQVRLPSGAEILVEYEQKDYAYVQDRTPMTMTSLARAPEKEMPDGGGNKYGLSPVYTINVRDLGLSSANTPEAERERQRQVDLLKEYFKRPTPSNSAADRVSPGNRLYFKFLYALHGKVAGGVADINNCNSEYITGYVSVDPASIKVADVGGERHIALTLDGQTANDLRKAGTSYESVPRQACYDYYTTQRLGKWNADCSDDLDKYDYMAYIEPKLQFNLEVAALLTNELLPKYLKDRNTYDAPPKVIVGADLNPALSFLKLPMLKAKKGGGVRVKRLMMYDPGIESGPNGPNDAGLYGQEYLYQDFKAEKVDGEDKLVPISSGVATNEPAEAREENPLVGFLPRASQGWFSRVTSGVDREQAEGPLGESILPAASVGHSRVVVSNLHGGRTGTGFTVHQYHTVKEYPFDGVYKGDGLNVDYGENNDAEVTAAQATALGVDHTPLSDNEVSDFLIIPGGLFFYKHNKHYAAQGYRFITNSMHGQMKRITGYAGDYNLTAANTEAAYPDNVMRRFHRVTDQQYDYFSPGEKVKMLLPDGRYVMALPGKETDIAMESRSVSDQTIDLSIEMDIFFGFGPPPTLYAPTIGFSLELSDQALSTHVTSKVIRYPAILRKVTTTQDGVVSESENLAFNPHTGQPVLVRTADGFDRAERRASSTAPTTPHDGSMYTLTLPASWYYGEMGPRTGDPANANQLSASAGQIVSHGPAGNPLRTGTDTWATKPMVNVLQAQAQSFKKDWFLGAPAGGRVQVEADFGGIPQSAARDALNRLMRPYRTYVYREDVLKANGEASTGPAPVVVPIHRAGTFREAGTGSNALALFRDWLPAGVPAQREHKWVLTNEVEYYSPHGSAVQERNVLNVRSAAKYGYDGQLPVMIAGNAQYGNIAFEDFELPASVAGDNDPRVGHSGSGFRRLEPATAPGTANVLELTNRILIEDALDATGQVLKNELRRGGAILKVWVRSAAEPSFGVTLGGITPTDAPIAPRKVAGTGDWSLYEVVYPNSLFDKTSISSGTRFSIVLTNHGPAPLYIDDLRFQPQETQATCYVYDRNTLRLIAQFDDQHFGLYYQYNDEGRLVRKLIETERGIKTVQETQYNTPKRPRLAP